MAQNKLISTWLFLSLTCLIFLCSVGVKAQKGGDVQKLICQKWYLEKYAEGDEEPVVAPDFFKDSYSLDFEDGSMTSLENGIKVQGKWTYNTETKQLIGTQTENSDFPQEVAVEVVEVSTKQMIVKGTDAEGNTLTLYLYSK